MVLIWIFARRRPPQIRAFGEVVGAQHPWSIVEFFADAWWMSSQKKWRRAAHYLFPTEHLKSPMFWIFAKKWQKSGFLKFEHLFTRAREIFCEPTTFGLKMIHNKYWIDWSIWHIQFEKKSPPPKWPFFWGVNFLWSFCRCLSQDAVFVFSG